MTRKLLAALGAGVLACAGCARGREVPFAPLPDTLARSCLREPAEAVMRSAAEWERFRAAAGCADAAPAVDFAREMVLVYALGRQYTGAVRVRMDRLAAGRDGSLTAYLTVTRPTPGCAGPGNIVYPRVALRTPHRAGEVRFEVRQRRESC
jgi:hypothetical protein